jgi:hypothetical protein
MKSFDLLMLLFNSNNKNIFQANTMQNIVNVFSFRCYNFENFWLKWLFVLLLFFKYMFSPLDYKSMKTLIICILFTHLFQNMAQGMKHSIW